MSSSTSQSSNHLASNAEADDPDVDAAATERCREPPAKGMSPRSNSPRRCKVLGCSADLKAEGKMYCIQRQICKRHLKAEVIVCRETKRKLRFCLQCAKLEPLSAFEGHHRSCEASLVRRRRKQPVVETAADDSRLQKQLSSRVLHESSPDCQATEAVQQPLQLLATPDMWHMDQQVAMAPPAFAANSWQKQQQLQQPAGAVYDTSTMGTMGPAMVSSAPVFSPCMRLTAPRAVNVQALQAAIPVAAAAAQAAAQAAEAALQAATACAADCQPGQVPSDPFELMLMQMMHEELSAIAAEEVAGSSRRHTGIKMTQHQQPNILGRSQQLPGKVLAEKTVLHTSSNEHNLRSAVDQKDLPDFHLGWRDCPPGLHPRAAAASAPPAAVLQADVSTPAPAAAFHPTWGMLEIEDMPTSMLAAAAAPGLERHQVPAALDQQGFADGYDARHLGVMHEQISAIQTHLTGLHHATAALCRTHDTYWPHAPDCTEAGPPVPVTQAPIYLQHPSRS